MHAALRLAQRLRPHPRRHQGRPLPHRAGGRAGGRHLQADLLARNQRPHLPLPAGRRRASRSPTTCPSASPAARRGSGSSYGGSKSSAAPSRCASNATPRSTSPATPHKVELTNCGAVFTSDALVHRADHPLRAQAPRRPRRRGGGRSAPAGRADDLRPPPARPRAQGRAGARRGAGTAAVRADRRLLAPLARQVHVHGPLARDGPPLGSGLEAADVRAPPARSSPRRRAACPSRIGGPRNWDYRYTWIRDAAFSLYGLLRIGFTEEAAAFMGWLEQRCHERKADGGPADRLRPSRRARTAGADARPPRRLPRLPPRARRQRRRRTVPARHLRRADGQRVPLQQVRRTDQLRPLGRAVGPARLGVRQLETPRRRHLGDPRRAEALRLLQAHVLGRRRPRPAPRRQAVVPRRPRAVGAAAATTSTSTS